MMTLHKLAAGDGYTYLTRQVATGDCERTTGEDLADYYSAKGEAPGLWRGGGAQTLGVSGQVHERQMLALFGEGLHPEADQIIAAKVAELGQRGVHGEQAHKQALAAAKLGNRFMSFGRGNDWHERLSTAYDQAATSSGQPLTEGERAEVKAAFAATAFESEHSRSARDRAELAAWVTRQAAPQRVAVAGFDLVFTPVKSVSVLWALGDEETRTAVEVAHAAAVTRALDYVENETALTRAGRGGVAQIDTSGLTIAAFDHRDSRAGEPNLHTHAAVSTKVLGADGKWRSLDARVLHAAGVSASERYNTAIEDELVGRLGVTFTARGGARAAAREGGREVREILGVDPRLITAFSSRRAAIEARHDELVRSYRTAHGHEPPAAVRLHLAQQATLETREGKAEPRSLAEQRTDWLAITREVLQLPDQTPALMVEALITQTARPHTVGRVHREPPALSQEIAPGPPVRGLVIAPDAGVHVRLASGASITLDALEHEHYRPPAQYLDSATRSADGAFDRAVGGAVEQASQPLAAGWEGPTAQQVAAVLLATTEAHHTTWTRFTLDAEAQRRLRRLTPVTGPLQGEERDALTREIVDLACTAGLEMSAPALNSVCPPELTRADGVSVFAVHGTQRWSSTRILDAEEALLAATQRRVSAPALVRHVRQAGSVASAAAQRHGRPAPDAAQLRLAEVFATSDRLLEVGIGAAGTGKTTSMRVMVDAVRTAGGRVIALAPSAAAAAVLGEELGVHAETIHTFQLLAERTEDGGPGWKVRPGDVVLVDEAGMAGTLRLQEIVDLAARNGAAVRLLGDPQQLTAVESGGALRLLEREGHATHLRDVHRFIDPAEAAATLAVRAGKPAAIDFYRDAGRLSGGTREAMMEAVYNAWRDDVAQGRSTLMLAGSTAAVTQLSAHARLDRILAGEVTTTVEVDLHDGNQASAGDVIVTRRNERQLITHAGKDFVKNGDTWTIAGVTDDGGLRVVHRNHHGVLTLPADYVEADVELAYAATVHRAQGMTVTTAHLLVDETSTRESLYVGLTRGREGNHVYAVTDATDPAHVAHPVPGTAPMPDAAAEQVFARALAAESVERPASEVLRGELDEAASLRSLVPAYEYALALDDEIRYSLTLAVRDALPAEREAHPDGRKPQIIASDVLEHTAWTTIAASLAAHARAGADPAVVLADAVAARELGSAEDPVLVLAWRLEAESPREDHQRHTGLPSWVPAPPDPGRFPSPVVEAGEVDTLAAWLSQQAEMIAARIDTGVDLALVDQPRWLAALGPVPDHEDGRQAWSQTLREVVAWRDQLHLDDENRHPTGERDPLGSRPAAGPAARAWQDLDAQLRELSRAGRPQAPVQPQPIWQPHARTPEPETEYSHWDDVAPEVERDSPQR